MRAKGEGSIRKRSDGRWEARIITGIDPATGKSIRKSVYGKTQSEVKKKMQSICVEVDEGTYSDPVKLNVAEWLDIWLKEYTLNLKPYTLKTYTNIIETHLKKGLGGIKLSALSPHLIQTFYNKLIRSKGLSAKTIKNIHGVLHISLNQAAANGYINSNPCDSCTLPKINKPEINPFDELQIAEFIKAIKGDPYEILFAVTIFTGMRQGEILGLKWDNVNFGKETIHISQQLQLVNGKYILSIPKSGKSRTITPAPYVMNLLRKQSVQQKEAKLLAGPLWKDENFVFTDALGEHLKIKTVYKHFKKIVTDMGYPNVRFHDLRHSYAVSSIVSGDDIKTVQDNLGHHTAAFTLDVYGHVTEQMKKESANRMQEFINKLGV